MTLNRFIVVEGYPAVRLPTKFIKDPCCRFKVCSIAEVTLFDTEDIATEHVEKYSTNHHSLTVLAIRVELKEGELWNVVLS